MIEVALRAIPMDGPVVVTTAQSIDQQAIQDTFGPVLARAILVVEKVTRVRPMSVTLIIQWAGEEDDDEKEEEKPAPPTKSHPVPKWMS